MPGQLDAAAQVTAEDPERDRLFWRYRGTPLFNAMLNAKGRVMTRWPDWGYKRMDTNVLHLFTECPEGKIIAIAKRDGVKTNDPEAMEGLELCEWCQAQDETEKPR